MESLLLYIYKFFDAFFKTLHPNIYDDNFDEETKEMEETNLC
jgi:hypothetical protein